MSTKTIPGLPGVIVAPEVLHAYYFANAAHAAVKQLRNYTAEPYIVHPVAVLAILHRNCGPFLTVPMQQAALLHDVIEDTGVTGELVRQLFGATVAEYVLALSKATTSSFGNRAQRHTFEVERLAKSPWQVQTIKVADLMDNTVSIVDRDPTFARTYLVEKAHLLKAMTNAMPTLRTLALAQLSHSAEVMGVDLEMAP